METKLAWKYLKKTKKIMSPIQSSQIAALNNDVIFGLSFKVAVKANPKIQKASG